MSLGTSTAATKLEESLVTGHGMRYNTSQIVNLGGSLGIRDKNWVPTPT